MCHALRMQVVSAECIKQMGLINCTHVLIAEMSRPQMAPVVPSPPVPALPVSLSSPSSKPSGALIGAAVGGAVGGLFLIIALAAWATIL